MSAAVLPKLSVQEEICPLHWFRAQYRALLATWREVDGISISRDGDNLSMSVAEEAIIAGRLRWVDVASSLRRHRADVLMRSGYDQLVVVPGGSIAGIYARLFDFYIKLGISHDSTLLYERNSRLGHHKVVWGQRNSGGPLLGAVTVGMPSKVWLMRGGDRTLEPKSNFQDLCYQLARRNNGTQFATLPTGLAYVGSTMALNAADCSRGVQVVCASSAWANRDEPTSPDVWIPKIVVDRPASGVRKMKLEFQSSADLDLPNDVTIIPSSADLDPPNDVTIIPSSADLDPPDDVTIIPSSADLDPPDDVPIIPLCIQILATRSC